MVKRQWHRNIFNIQWRKILCCWTDLLKIYKHIRAVSINVCFDMLNDILDKYNNTYHTTKKMKSINVKSNSYAK